MIFRRKNGEYEGVLAGGKTVPFEDKKEMLECARERREILRLLGKAPENTISVVKKNVPSGQKKKVRFTIDPDVEYFGKEKALA